MKSTLLSLFTLFSILTLSSQTVAIDADFGNNGFTPTSLISNQSIKILANDRIILANYIGSNLVLTRLDEYGKIDNSFGIEGVTKVFFDNADFKISGIYLGINNEIKVVGIASYPNTASRMIVFQFLPSGSLDNNYGDDGILKSEPLPFSFEQNTFKIDVKESIFLFGQKIVTSNGLQKSDFAIIKYQPNGSLDTNFGDNGAIIKDMGGTTENITDITFTSNEKIIVGGFTGENNILLQYDSNGKLDENFGENGVILFEGRGNDIFGGINKIYSLRDGKILTTGTHSNKVQRVFGLYKFNSDGTVDKNFGKEGRVLTDYVQSEIVINDTKSRYSILQENEKVILVGTKYLSRDNYAPIMIRYNENGSIDKDFGEEGKIMLEGYEFGDFYFVQKHKKGYLMGLYYWSSETLSNEALLTRISDNEEKLVNIFDLQDLKPDILSVFPNPVHYTATLKYDIAKTSTVTIKLINSMGQVLKTYLNSEVRTDGIHTQNIEFPKGIGKGVYLLVLTSNLGQKTIRVIK